jgi:sulfur carrier protein ThiS adenylyltransferase
VVIGSGAPWGGQASQLDDSDIERYSRQLLLEELGEPEQLRLRRARVAVIGCGGLGGPAALHLVGAGVGRILLIDPDLVSLDNLHRQVAFRTADIGRSKVRVLGAALRHLNPRVEVEEEREQLLPEALEERLQGSDLVLECSDQPSLKFAVNDWCVAHGLPLVVGGAIGWRGQVTTVTAESGCFRCLFRAPNPATERSCQSAGVIGPLVGVIGALQALEGVRLLIGPNQGEGRLADFDGRTGRWRSLRLLRDPGCRAHLVSPGVRP